LDSQLTPYFAGEAGLFLALVGIGLGLFVWHRLSNLADPRITYPRETVRLR
jgi:hypothetical protein